MSGDSDGRGTERFFGWALITLGGLIATLSGLCTLGWFAVMASESGPSVAPIVEGGLTVLLIGGVPFGAGVLLLVVGLRVLRTANRPTAAKPEKTFE